MVREQSFMKALFHGAISEELILPYPQPDPRERHTLDRLRDDLRRFGETHVDSARIDRDARIPPETLDQMRSLGLFGIGIPQAYGGLGLSHTGSAQVMEALAGLDLSVALTVGAHHGLGTRALVLAGTERQKRRYLPRMARGEALTGLALTEARAGSDPSHIEARAEVAPDGEGFLINGSKRWVTNGGLAEVVTVFCRAEVGQEGSSEVTAFLVGREDGLRSGPQEPTLGVRGTSTTALFLEDLKVPSRNLLGAPGGGLELAMQTFNEARPQLAAACLGACRRVLAMAVERAAERRAYGRPIGTVGMTQQRIARMACDVYALHSMVYLTTGLIDAGVPDYSMESAICKVYAADTLWRMADDTLQIAGAEGYMCDRPYERLLRDARLPPLYWGPNETLRAFIALAGLQGPSEQRVEVASALKEPLRALGMLGDFALQRARSALGAPRLEHVHPALKGEAAQFEADVASLAQAADRALRKHGRDLPDRQIAQAHLADMAIQLFAGAAVLSNTTQRIEARGEEGARRETDLAAGFVSIAHSRIVAALRRLEGDEDHRLEQLAGHAHQAGGV